MDARGSRCRVENFEPAFARWSGDLASGREPEQMFALVGQMTTADPTRSPSGTESAWAYTHLPRDRYAAV